MEQLLKKLFNLNIKSYTLITPNVVKIVGKSGTPYKALRNGDKVTLMKGNFFVSKVELPLDSREIWTE